MKKFLKFCKAWLLFIMASCTVDMALSNSVNIAGVDVPEERNNTRGWYFIWESIYWKIKALIKYYKE